MESPDQFDHQQMKTIYRRASRLYHPDKRAVTDSSDDIGQQVLSQEVCQLMFRCLSGIYEVLEDETQREMYFSRNSMEQDDDDDQPFILENEWLPEGIEEVSARFAVEIQHTPTVIQSIFANGTMPASIGKYVRENNITAMTQIFQPDTQKCAVPIGVLYRGAKEYEVQLYRRLPCQECHGRGVSDPCLDVLCSTCQGAGHWILNQTCSICNGAGRVFPKDAEKCQSCNGACFVDDVAKVSVDIPIGFGSSGRNTLILHRQGSQTFVLPDRLRGLPLRWTSQLVWHRPKDVILTVETDSSHEQCYLRDGNHLHYRIQINLPQLLQGIRQVLQHPRGEPFRIVLSELHEICYRPKFTVLVRGKGFPLHYDEWLHQVNGGGQSRDTTHGDVYIDVEMHLPKKAGEMNMEPIQPGADDPESEIEEFVGSVITQ